jgi:leucine dehydrogenase
MTMPWGLPDFDDHEEVHFVTDEKCGLKAIIAVHSTHLGPAAGGARFWHYAEDADALTDALRLSRGMSYKNAMAGLPLGGGKSVLLADADKTKTPEFLHAFGKSVEHLGGRYVTAEDVGMSVADMIEVARSTRFVAGLPNSAGDVGGDPGPHTSLGVFLGIKAAVKWALGKDSLNGLHIALQGAGSVATGVALHACAEGARLSIADVDETKAQKLAERSGGKVVGTDEILTLEADVLSPNALGAILDAKSIPALKVPVVAGGANNQLATPEDGERLHQRNILYAPDYVINAGGIINVCTEYLGDGDATLVRRRIEGIPVRLEQIWKEGAETGRDPAAVADAMAQRLIGRSYTSLRAKRSNPSAQNWIASLPRSSQ